MFLLSYPFGQTKSWVECITSRYRTENKELSLLKLGFGVPISFLLLIPIHHSCLSCCFRVCGLHQKQLETTGVMEREPTVTWNTWILVSCGVTRWLGGWLGAITSPSKACFPFPMKELNIIHGPPVLMFCGFILTDWFPSGAHLHYPNVSRAISSVFFLFSPYKPSTDIDLAVILFQSLPSAKKNYLIFFHFKVFEDLVSIIFTCFLQKCHVWIRLTVVLATDGKVFQSNWNSHLPLPMTEVKSEDWENV